MDETQRLDSNDDEEETSLNRERPVGNLHMFAGGYGLAQDFAIYHGQNVIGRHASCDITLPAQSVSKKHAVLEVRGDCRTICDNGSLNKTRRGKTPLTPHVLYALSDGDFLMFADVACRYTIEQKVVGETTEVEESEEDSMVVPATQGALAIEKTPGAAIRRRARGTVLARDSGDEEDDGGQNRGDEGACGSFRGINKTSGSGTIFSPVTDTIVPESDEEDDTSTSEMVLPSLTLRCDSDTDTSRRSSFVPSSQNISTPVVLADPSKHDGRTLTAKDNEEMASIKTAHAEMKMRLSVEENREEEKMMESTCGGSVSEPSVQVVALDDGFKKEQECQKMLEDALKKPFSDRMRSPHAEDNVASSRSETVQEAKGELNPEVDVHNFSDTDVKPKEHNVSLDSESKSQEDAATSGIDVMTAKTSGIQTNKSEEDSGRSLETKGTIFHMDSDTDLEEDDTIRSDLEKAKSPQVADIKEPQNNASVPLTRKNEGASDSDTDVEGDQNVIKSKNDNEEAKKTSEPSNTEGTAELGIDSDTDEEDDDGDIPKPVEIKVDQDSRSNTEEKKEGFLMDSDTDVEEDVSTVEVKEAESPKTNIKETKDVFNLDSDTDVDEEVDVSIRSVTHGPQETSTASTNVQEATGADSDTDEQIPGGSNVTLDVTDDEPKEKTDVLMAKEAPALQVDSDTDDEQIPRGSNVTFEVTDDEPKDKTDILMAKEGPALQVDSDTDDEQIPRGSNVTFEVTDDEPKENTDVLMAKEAPALQVDSDTDDEQIPRGSKVTFEVTDDEPKDKTDVLMAKEAPALQVDSDTDVDEDDGLPVIPVVETVGASESITHTDSVKKDTEMTEEAADLYLDSEMDVEEGDGSSVSRREKPRVEEHMVHTSGVQEEVGVEDQESSVSSADEIVAVSGISTEETKNVPTEICTEEDETQKADSESADLEMMATQCYLEPQESDLPDDDDEEEEATQAFIFSSTWAEPQPFKRPADPMGVLQISPVTSNESKEEIDENAIAETQDFCTEEAAIGPSVPKTPEPAERNVNETTECTSSEERPGNEVQQLGTMSPDATQPISQCLSTGPSPETSTWLHLKRDVPASVCIQGIQPVGHSTHLKGGEETEDATQADDQSLKLELEATQLYAVESPPVEKPPTQSLTPTVPAAGEKPPERTEQPRSEDTQVTDNDATQAYSLCVPEDGTTQASSLSEETTSDGATQAYSLGIPGSEDGTTQACKLSEETKSDGATHETTSDGATQVYTLGIPGSEDGTTQASKLPEETTSNGATQVTTIHVAKEDDDTQVVDPSVPAAEEVVAETSTKSEEKLSSRRGLSRRKKQPDPSENVMTSSEPKEHPDKASAGPVMEEQGDQSAGEPQLSEPEIKPAQVEKGVKRGAKSIAESQAKTAAKEEVLVATTSRKRTGKISSEAEPSTSGTGRKQVSRKSAIKVVKEVLKEEHEQSSSNTEELTKSLAPKILPENLPEETSEVDKKGNAVERKSKESGDQASLDNEDASTSSTVAESKALTESNTNSADSRNVHQNKKPATSKRRMAAKLRNEDADETESIDNVDKDIGGRNSRTIQEKDERKQASESQQITPEEGRGRKATRKSQVKPLEPESDKTEDIREKNKKVEADAVSENQKSKRTRGSMKEEIKNPKEPKEEEPQEETKNIQEGKGKTRRGANVKDVGKGQANLEEMSKSINIPRRTRKNSNAEATKTEQVEEDVKLEDVARKSKRAQKNPKEEQNTDNIGTLETPRSNAQTSRRTRKNSKAEDTKTEQVEEDVKLEEVSKKSKRAQKNPKEEQNTEDNSGTPETPSSNLQTSRRTRKNSKAEDTKTEQVVEIVNIEEVSRKSKRVQKNLKEQNTEDSIGTPETPRSHAQTSRRTRKNSKAEDTKTEQVEEDVKLEEVSRKSKRAQKNPKEQNIEDHSGTPETSSSNLQTSRRTRKNSKAEDTKTEQVAEIVNVEEVSRKSKRVQKNPKEEQNTEDNIGTPETPRSNTQTSRRTRSEHQEEDNVVKKETTSRKTRHSKEEEAVKLEEDQTNKSRTRKNTREEAKSEETAKERFVEEDNAESIGRKSTRKSRHVTDEENELKQIEDNSKSERLSRTRSKTSHENREPSGEARGVNEKAEESEKVSPPEEKSKPAVGRGRPASKKEDTPPVSTPGTSRKRGQAAKVEVEVKRKKSDEGVEQEELGLVETPKSRRGRSRKLVSEAESSQTGKEASTPDPSPSRGANRRPSSALSNTPEAGTPRRTNRTPTSSTSPYVAQAGSAPKILFTGVVDTAREKAIRALGGDIADSVYDCTHLVTDRIRRTVKFLCALARGVPIVTLDWIDKCKKSGRFLSPTGFLVNDQEQEKNFNFVLSESLQKAKKRPLFEGYEIHVTANVKPDPEQMKDIIQCSGATYLPKMPRSFKDKSVVVSCPEDAARCRSVPASVPITSAEFILSGILHQSVNAAAHQLTPAPDPGPTPAKRRR